MNRSSWIALMVVAGLGLGCVMNVSGAATSTSQLVSEAKKSIKAAETAVEEARVAIAGGKQLLATIPEGSPLMGEVTEMLKKTKENWTLAVSALEGARESASKISAASSPEIALDYQLLAKVNAGVARSGATVVKTSMLFIDAVANNKTEALGVIREAVNNALEAAGQVQLNYERVKGYIAKKYSK